MLVKKHKLFRIEDILFAEVDVCRISSKCDWCTMYFKCRNEVGYFYTFRKCKKMKDKKLHKLCNKHDSLVPLKYLREHLGSKKKNNKKELSL